MTPEQVERRAADLQHAGLTRRAITCWRNLAARVDATDAQRERGFMMANRLFRNAADGLSADPDAIRQREHRRLQRAGKA